MLVVEGDDGLIAASTGHGVPIHLAFASGKMEVVTIQVVGSDENLLDSVAQVDRALAVADHGSVGARKGVAGGIADDQKLIDAVRVRHKLTTRNAIVDRLQT